MRSWFATFMALAAFAMVVACVTCWLCSRPSWPPFRLLRQFVTRQKKSGTRPGETPGTEDPPEAA